VSPWALVPVVIELAKIGIAALGRKAVAPITRIRSRRAENEAHKARVRAEAAARAAKP